MSTLTIQDPVKAISLRPEEVAFYKSEGYLLLPGLLAGEFATALRADVLSIVSKVNGVNPSKLSQTGQYLAGTPLDALIHSAILHAVVSQLMGGEATIYLPFTAVKTAGGSTFDFHQDNMYTRLEGPALNCWFALNDMEPDNGNLCIVPRSHLGGTLASQVSRDGDGHRAAMATPTDFLHMRMHAGDCVIFDRLTVHGSVPNLTAAHRVGYAVQYCRQDVSYWLDGTLVKYADRPRWGNAINPVAAITGGKQVGE